VLALRAGNAVEAVAEFSESLKRQPDSAFTLEWRAAAYRRSGESDKALGDNESLIHLRPHLLRAYIVRGSLLRQQGRVAEAVQVAEAAIAANASNAEAYVTAAEIYMTSAKPEEAMHSLDQSLALSPTVQAYLRRADYRAMSDLAGRQADLEAALKLDPKSAATVTALARALSDAGKHEDAENTLTQGIAVLGNDPALLTSRGILYAKTAQQQRADKEFAALRGKYSDPSILNNMCWALATEGVALDTALSACESAVTQRPEESAFQDSRGFVLLRLGRYADAVTAYDASLKLIPERSMSLYGRGVAKRLRGDQGGGDADINHALQLDAHVATVFADYGIKL
jgi:tetratricopeptide (TPR) repeat protein